MLTIVYTLLALSAFAANSVLCRIALRNGAIDAASFSFIRLAAGAAALLLISAYTGKGRMRLAGSWVSAALLFSYAVFFSFAYTRLTAGTGALILFGCVQITMMSGALWTGERPHLLQWFGLGLSLAGLVYLMLPGLAAPPLVAGGLMGLSGICWGIYSLRGRGTANSLAHTTGNFLRSVPLVLAVSLASLSRLRVGGQGTLLALASGALASGVGYVVWYRALRGLTATRAAVVQLAVPVFAATGGVVFLKEIISGRQILAAAMVLGGIALALLDSARETAKGT